MKAYHNNPEKKQELVNKITSWYQWMIDNAPESVNQATKVLSSTIGHISSKNISVQITIEDVAGNRFNVYVTPEGWWAKKFLKGQTYGNFSKKLMQSLESYEIN